MISVGAEAGSTEQQENIKKKIDDRPLRVVRWAR